MFRSGNFYVEYQVLDELIASDMSIIGIPSSVPQFFKISSNRSVRNSHSNTPKFLSFASSKRNHYLVFAGKDGARLFRANVKDANPDVFYQDGKYYNFIVDTSGSTSRNESKIRRMLVLPEDQINSPILDPNEEWQYVRDDLAVPDGIAIFYWNDPYRDKSSDFGEPAYSDSSTKTIGKKTYDCDRYIVDIKSLAGTLIAQEAYDALYEGGRLVMIQRYFVRNDKETLVQTVNIKNITPQVPDNAFAINKKVKIYAPRNGDMNDLLEVYEQVGEIGGGKK